MNFQKIIDNPYLNLAIRLLVGLMFVTAGLPKIMDPKHFVTEIFNYQLMPDIFLNPIAIIIPWVEVIAGIMLIAGVKVKANSAIIGTLLFIFIIMVSSAILRGLEINCGCFGKDKVVVVNWGKVLENTGLLCLMIITYFSNNKKFCLN